MMRIAHPLLTTENLEDILVHSRRILEVRRVEVNRTNRLGVDVFCW